MNRALGKRHVERIGPALSAARRHPLKLLREAARVPLQQQAAERIGSLPVIELSDLTGDVRQIPVVLGARDSRHAWSLGAAEQLILQVLICARGCKMAFEIGTFNGGTTRVLAETLPADGKVWTVDLPPAEFDMTQGAAGFTGSQIGVAYRDSWAAQKIVQIFADSLAYDFGAYERSVDLVLVDAGHEYPNGLADTKTALRLVRPGGIVLWDDFEPYWHGLVHGICDAMQDRHFGRLAGTSFAVYAAP
jgi:predicted O-methyltransferase YrrM